LPWVAYVPRPSANVRLASFWELSVEIRMLSVSSRIAPAFFLFGVCRGVGGEASGLSVMGSVFFMLPPKYNLR